MFGLSEAHFNIAKKQARKCSEEITNLIAKGAKYDAVAAKAIDDAHSKVATIITRMQFVWLIGFLNGRYKSGDRE